MVPVGFLFVFIIGAGVFGTPLRVQAAFSVSLSAAPPTVSNPGESTDLTIDIVNGQSSATPYTCKFVYDDTGKEITSFSFYDQRHTRQLPNSHSALHSGMQCYTNF